MVRRRLIVLAVLALTLSACELRAEIAVNDDGSGTVGMVFAIEPEMIALFSQSGAGDDPFAALRSDLADDPVAWNVDEFTEGRLQGLRATFSFASIDDLIDKMEALDGDSGGDAAFQDFTLVRLAGGWVFEGRSSDPQTELAGGQVPIPIDQLATLLTVQFRVTLPGRGGEHNADEVSSGSGRTTFIWKPDLRSDAIDLRAATMPGGASKPVLPIGLALAALVVVAVVWFRRARSASGPEPASFVADHTVASVAGVPSTDRLTGDAKEEASLPR